MSLLQVRDLVVEFPGRPRPLRALDGLSFDIGAGEMLGLVGESGAGKSLAGAALAGLLPPPGRQAGGTIRLDGRRIDDLPPARLREIRGREIGWIFQDPMTALDPLQTVGSQLVETIRTHLPLGAAEARRRAADLLRETGLSAPEQRLDQHPHQLSGGMRQRVVIALALAAGPRLVIADEPTTALDVCTQAQVIARLRALGRAHGVAVLLITHDMGVVAEACDRVAVMYAGRLVEEGPVEAVLHAPAHPYTRGLMACIPDVDRDHPRLHQIDGAMPRPGAWPPGCAFHPRCDRALPRCAADGPPPMREAAGRRVACWLHDAPPGATR